MTRREHGTSSFNLSVSLASKYLGFVLSNQEGVIVDWGVKDFKGTEPDIAVKHFKVLIETYRPSLVTLQDTSDTYSQIDLTNNLIHLNPTGRQQNKKYRPTVRLPQQLRAYVRLQQSKTCLLYTSPSPRDRQKSRMPSSA